MLISRELRLAHQNYFHRSMLPLFMTCGDLGIFSVQNLAYSIFFIIARRWNLFNIYLVCIYFEFLEPIRKYKIVLKAFECYKTRFKKIRY